ncbi:MAG: c-type cytochrome [Pararhodobacter sp.]
MSAAHTGLRFRARSCVALVLASLLAFPLPSLAADEAVDFDAVMAERFADWHDAGMPEPLLAQIGSGAEVWRDHCAACHGDLGEGGGGYASPVIDTRGLDKLRTGHRLFIYNRGMMPFQEPGSLDEEAYWQVTAWMMAMNGWLDTLDAPLGADNARGVAIEP